MRLGPALVVILETDVRNQIFAAHPSYGVFKSHELNTNLVFRVVESEPLLNNLLPGTLSGVHMAATALGLPSEGAIGT